MSTGPGPEGAPVDAASSSGLAAPGPAASSSGLAAPGPAASSSGLASPGPAEPSSGLASPGPAASDAVLAATAEAPPRFLPEGAALGLPVGPMALIGQAASGLGDASWYVGVLASILGGLLGGYTLPFFLRPGTPEARPLSPGFGAVFTCALGLLAGAMVAFPMGAVLASTCGLGAGLAGALVWRGSTGRAPSGPSSGSAPGSSGPSSGSAPGSSGPSSGSAPGSSGAPGARRALLLTGLCATAVGTLLALALAP